MPCFWCNIKFDEMCRERRCTKDHVIPLALGGARGGNLVDACFECNHERGTIVDYMLLLETIAKKGCKRGTYKKIVARHSFMLERQKRWATIEYRILRRSPTANLNLDMPEIVGFIDDSDTSPKMVSRKPPKKATKTHHKGYAAILREARRVAEARHFIPMSPTSVECYG